MLGEAVLELRCSPPKKLTHTHRTICSKCEEQPHIPTRPRAHHTTRHCAPRAVTGVSVSSIPVPLSPKPLQGPSMGTDLNQPVLQGHLPQKWYGWVES